MNVVQSSVGTSMNGFKMKKTMNGNIAVGLIKHGRTDNPIFSPSFK